MIQKIINKQSFRYALSGLLSFTIENTVFISCFYLLNVHAAKANIIALTIALTINFFTTKYFVFHNKTSRKKSATQAGIYILLVVFNGVISTLLVVMLIDAGISAYIAKLFISLIVILWTYLLYNKIIFREVSND